MVRRERVSVALCTYNGERYLQAQLASISDQSVKPDEVVVYDDGSADSSLSILSRWRDSAPFEVSILPHERNLGVAAAFEKAIRACSGDLVFTCDQDDVWIPAKIEWLASRLNEAPDVQAVASNARPTTATLTPLPLDMWSSLGLNPYLLCSLSPNQVFEKLLVPGNFVSGMSLAFRRQWAETVWPAPPGWLHDAWIAIAAATQDGLLLDGGELVLYRQHSHNALGVPKFAPIGLMKEWLTLDLSGFPLLAGRFSVVLDRLGSSMVADRRARVSYLAHHYLERSRLEGPQRNRLTKVIRGLASGAYEKNALGMATAVTDLLRPVRMRPVP